MNLISILVSSANATAPQGLEHIPHTHLLINGAAGWSISANQLLDQAAALGGDAIFCDDDVTFLPESLDGVRAHYQQADAFGFDLHDLSGARQCGARHTFPDGVLTDWIHPGPAYVGHVSTSAIYLTEKAIQSGVRFPVWPGVHWEDVGYTLGLWLAGCRVLAVPGRVNHNIVGGIGATKRHTPEFWAKWTANKQAFTQWCWANKVGQALADGRIPMGGKGDTCLFTVVRQQQKHGLPQVKRWQSGN